MQCKELSKLCDLQRSVRRIEQAAYFLRQQTKKLQDPCGLNTGFLKQTLPFHQPCAYCMYCQTKVPGVQA